MTPRISSSFSTYFEARMARILLLGMMSGFPWVLIGSTLSLWLKEEGLSRSAVGWAGLIFAVYAVNFFRSTLFTLTKCKITDDQKKALSNIFDNK